MPVSRRAYEHLWQARFGANAQALRNAQPLLGTGVADQLQYRAGLQNNDELVELLTPRFVQRLVHDCEGRGD